MAKTILLADDSVMIQKVIELTFIGEDFQVDSVSSGDDALERLDAGAPDVVIADVHMHESASGYAVARKSKDLYPQVPVLLLVGSFEPFDEQEFADCGADRYLKKPFESEELERLVTDLMAQSGGAASADAAAPPPAPQPAVEESPPEPLAFDQFEDLESPAASPAPESPAVEAGEPFSLGGGEPEAGSEDVPVIPTATAPEAFPPSAETPDVFSFQTEDEGDDKAAEPIAPETSETSEAGGGGTDFRLDLDAEDELGDDEIDQEIALPSTEPAAEDETPPAFAAGVAPEPSFVEPKEVQEAAEEEPAVEAAAEAEETEDGDEEAEEIPAGALTEEDLERIARRVADLVGEHLVREVAWEVVPDLAEVIIKDRLRELESQVE
ncbi:MAG: response regulator [Acidobacteriota bacterium]|nr:response regulator [Acidobacteriota bacterium]